MPDNKMTEISHSFLSFACDILADTDTGLTGSTIVKYCNSYAIKFGTNIPFSEYPFPNKLAKRKALLENLLVFKPEHQCIMIKELCELEVLSGNPKVEELKSMLMSRYGFLCPNYESVNEALIEETKHWLEPYKKPYEHYLKALGKINNDIFLRNALDDLRLSLELLLKDIFNNSKSLENQISEVGSMVNEKGGSSEFANMFQKLLEYYTKYQNTYIKHGDKVNELEIEFMVEITSSFMKHIIKLSND